jgi:hypothetical protein
LAAATKNFMIEKPGIKEARRRTAESRSMKSLQNVLGSVQVKVPVSFGLVEYLQLISG